MKLLNIIIVFFSIFCNAQNKELISKTYLKLQNDSKSFFMVFVIVMILIYTQKHLKITTQLHLII